MLPLDKENLQNLIATYYRRLEFLKEKQAQMGYDTPSVIIDQIKDAVTKLSDLKAEFSALGKTETSADVSHISSREQQYQIVLNWVVYGRRANLSRFDLTGRDLQLIDLAGANLSLANFERANLYLANLQRVDFRLAVLSEAVLEKANLSGANLSGANLSGANLSEANLDKANLSASILNGTNLRQVNLNKA